MRTGAAIRCLLPAIAAGACSVEAAPETDPPAPADGGVVEASALRTGSIVRVLHVVDGDTLDVELVAAAASVPMRVRVAGLAAPECHKQPDGMGSSACSHDDEYYGLGAYQEAKALLAGSSFRVACDVPADTECEREYYGRYLGFIEDGQNDFSTSMARAGAGLSYTRYPSSRRAQVCRAEDDARAARRGMWALGTAEEVLARMSQGTRDWYRERDRRCAEAER